MTSVPARNGIALRATVILCTFNPDATRLQRVLDALEGQSRPKSDWDIVIVDNASPTPVADLGFVLPSNARLVLEPTAGLVHARLAGLRDARGDVIIFCDDDTVFCEDYIETAIGIIESDASIGLASGKSIPAFVNDPPPWLDEFRGCLALYDHGDRTNVCDAAERGYPEQIGGGCGAVFRRRALLGFVDAASRGDIITGRRGKDLTSGEDNDIVLTLIAQGWRAAYVPALRLDHIIPPSRMTRDYLARLNEAIARSWVKVLHKHGLNPWPPRSGFFLPFQMARAYVRFAAWRGPAEYIRWRGACGNFRGRADVFARDGRRGIFSVRASSADPT